MAWEMTLEQLDSFFDLCILGTSILTLHMEKIMSAFIVGSFGIVRPMAFLELSSDVFGVFLKSRTLVIS